MELDGRRVAGTRDFDAATGMLAPDSASVHLHETDARALVGRLGDTNFVVRDVEAKTFVERPKPPFKTTTLQQEAGNKLRFSAGRTMSVAQGLYERGYITYMRTDSISLSNQAVDAARAQIVERFGQAYLPPAPRTFANTTKNAQEAHEAIRPSGDRFRTPEDVRGELSRDEQQLYELIWMRTVASQMTDARGRRVTLRLGGASSTGEDVVFRASGKSYEFLGFRMAYVDVSDDPGGADDDEAVLPTVGEGEGVACNGLEANGHSTQPPARYTEATLVKVLEDSGIGRPSTYASIINTITSERGYVWKKGTALGAVVDGVREDPAPRALLRAPRRLRLHGHDGGSARRGRTWRGRGREVAPLLLLRQRDGRAPRARVGGQPRQDRHERGQQDHDRGRRRGHRVHGAGLEHRRVAARRRGQVPAAGRPAARRAHGGARQGADRQGIRRAS